MRDGAAALLTQDVRFWQEMVTLAVENVNIDDLPSGLSGLADQDRYGRPDPAGA